MTRRVAKRDARPGDSVKWMSTKPAMPCWGLVEYGTSDGLKVRGITDGRYMVRWERVAEVHVGRAEYDRRRTP